jgi:hypothetical protein
MMQLLSSTNGSKPNGANQLGLNTISSCMQASSSGGSAANAGLKYTNPPLPPRFLALSAQQQLASASSTTQSQVCNLSSGRSLAQPQRTLPPPQPASTITSGNSLNSFIAARNLAIQTNATANVFNLQHHYQQAQQQQQSFGTANGCNPATAALIAQLAAATSNKPLMVPQPVVQPQAQPPSATQCTLNNTLFVGNLHASLQEIDLIQVFRPFGRIVECCKKWLHFGFVKFSTEEEACHAYVTLNGFRLKGRPMRLEFQNRTKKVRSPHQNPCRFMVRLHPRSLKARIKAILAQAALQASKNQDFEDTLLSQINASTQSPLNVLLNARMHQQNIQKQQHVTKYAYDQQHMAPRQPDTEFTFFDAEKLLKFAIGDEAPVDTTTLPSYVEQAWNSVDANTRPKDDKSLRWIDDLSIGINHGGLMAAQSDAKHEQHSPVQDQHSASSSSSSLLSRSSFDSSMSCWAGAVSATAYFSENDSGIDQHKQQTRAVSKPASRCQTPQDFSLSEHLEFTCSGSQVSSAPSSAVQILNKHNLHKFTQQQQQQKNRPGSRCSKKSTNLNNEDDLEDHIEVDEESIGNDDDTIDDASVIPTDIDPNQDNNDLDDDDDICLNFDANFKELCIKDAASQVANGLFLVEEPSDFPEYRLFPNNCYHADPYSSNVF